MPTSIRSKLVTGAGRKVCTTEIARAKRILFNAYFVAPSGPPYELLCDAPASDPQQLKDCDSMWKSFTFEP